MRMINKLSNPLQSMPYFVAHTDSSKTTPLHTTFSTIPSPFVVRGHSNMSTLKASECCDSHPLITMIIVTSVPIHLIIAVTCHSFPTRYFESLGQNNTVSLQVVHHVFRQVQNGALGRTVLEQRVPLFELAVQNVLLRALWLVIAGCWHCRGPW